MQARNEIKEYINEMLAEQKKVHDKEMMDLRICLARLTNENINLKLTVEKFRNEIKGFENQIYHQDVKIAKLQEENTVLKSPIAPLKNTYIQVDILKVDSSDDESDDSQQKSAEGDSCDSQQIDDNYENIGFMPMISDEVRSYPWQPGRGFLDTIAYPFGCREHKRAIHALKTAAYEGDHEMLVKLIDDNKYTNIDGRGMADSICSRIRGFYDKTALTLAAQQGHLKCVKILVGKKADINKLDRENLTALDYAKENSHLEVINFLNRNNAMTGQEAIALLEKNNNIETKFKIS